MANHRFLELEKKGEILTVTLNRPEIKNAMNAEMIQEILAVFSNVPDDVRAVILRGSGNFFCAGGDIHWMKSSAQKSAEENDKDALQLARMIRAADECPVPLIAQVKGGAFGGGVGLVGASDIVIADESAVFSLSEVKLGLIPATIGPVVMRKIGVSEARRLYLTGRKFSAAEAQRIHLIHEVVPSGSLLSVTQDYLRELETSGPQAVRTAKKLIRETMGTTLWDPDVSEKTSKLLSRVRIGTEAQTGMESFLSGKAPPWKRSLI